MQIFAMSQPQQHMEPQVTLQNQAKGTSHPGVKATVDKNNLDFSSPLRRSLIFLAGLQADWKTYKLIQHRYGKQRLPLGFGLALARDAAASFHFTERGIGKKKKGCADH